MTEAPELARLADAIRAVVEANGAAPLPLVHDLRRKATEAFASDALAPAAANLLLDAMDGASEDAEEALMVAFMARNDREFMTHTVSGLAIGRLAFAELPANAEELDFLCRATDDGAIIPQPRDADEQVEITIACKLQVLVANALPEEDATRLHQRGFDFSCLDGSLNLAYGLRAMRRVAWGIATLVLTDRRVIAVIYEDRVPGVGSSPERLAMPLARVASYGSSVIVLACDRAVFEDCETSTGFLQSRMPYVNMTGDCGLAFDAMRVLNDQDRLVRPHKDQVAAAVRAFLRDAHESAVQPLTP